MIDLVLLEDDEAADASWLREVASWPPPENRRPRWSIKGSMGAGRGETVLLVEDGSLVAALSVLLDEAGYDVVTATSGEQALEALASIEPSLPCVVILDMMLPVMSGSQLLDVLEQTERLAHLPIIVLSASSATSERALAVLRKPTTVDRILDAVREGFRDVARRRWFALLH